jgi:hypothetical protein
MKRLTKEQLLDKAKFNFREKELPLPELGKEDGEAAGLLLRTPSIAHTHSLERASEERKDNGISSPEVIADLLATYCADPELSQKEWFEIVKEWPAPTMSRIYQGCADLAGTGEEEGRALATEFRGSDD